MNCNCNCNNVMRISSASTSDTAVFLVPSVTPTLSNKKRFKLIIQTNNGVTSSLPVYITIGSNNIPLISSYSGNFIYANELETRKVYTIVYGNDNAFMPNGQFVVLNKICVRG